MRYIIAFSIFLHVAIDVHAQCSFSVTAPDVYYCGNGLVSVNASASTSGVVWGWAFTENGTLIDTPEEINGITYTVTNGGATLRIDPLDGPGGLTDPEVIWVRATKSGCTTVWEAINLIYSLPSVNAGVDQTACANASPFSLTDATPSGGTWYGTGVSGGVFTPQSAYIGAPKTLTYEYTDSNGCTNSDTRVVTIEGVPNQEQLEVCKTTGAVLLDTFSSVATGSWSGSNLTGNAYLPISAPEFGTVYFNYTTLANGCTGSASQVIHAYSHTPVSGPTISNPGSYLCESGSVTLSATGFAAGKYRWYDNNSYPILQSNGQLHTAASYSTPNLSSSKTYYVQGIDGNDCGTTMVEVGVSVVSNPSTPSVTNGSNCSDGNATIAISSPNSEYSYEWLDVTDQPIYTGSSETIGYILNSQGTNLQIQDIPGTSNFTVKIRAVKSAYPNCHSNYAMAYAIYRTPPSVSIGTSIPDATCTSTPSFTLSGASPSGGAWKVNTTQTASFDSYSLGAGNHMIYYSYTDQYGCSNDDSKQVNVISLSTPGSQTFRTVHGTTAELQPANPGTNKSYNWYTTTTGGTAFTTADSWTTGDITSTQTYYISLNNELMPACESVGRGVISVHPNYLPLVNAGVDQSMLIPQRSAALTATYSDPDGSVSTIVWQKVSGPEATLSDINSATLSVDDLLDGTYVFRFYAYDNYNFENHDDVHVVVAYPANNYNSVTTEIIQMPGVTSHSAVDTLDEQEKAKTIQYIDGLGRPLQQVQWRASFMRNDIVQPLRYDKSGREAIKYLSYIPNSADGILKVNAIDTVNYLNGDQALFYRGSIQSIATDSAAYAMTVFEPSPLNRIIEQGAPGKAWQPGTNHTITKQYLLNDTTDVFKINYSSETGGISLSPSATHYAKNSLICNKTLDEHQNDVLEYIDNQGRTVCKKVKASTGIYASTYYIYDDFGNLVVVLPPEAVDRIVNGN